MGFWEGGRSLALGVAQAERRQPPDQMCWWITVGVVSDYAAVQSQTVMSLSHLDRSSLGRNTCLCVCRRQSRHGNFDFIKAESGGRIGCLEEMYNCAPFYNMPVSV